MRKFILISAFVLTLPIPALAQEHLLADLNSDGKVDLEEYQRHRRTYIMYADKDKDKQINREEWAKGQERLKWDMRREDIDGWQAVGKGNLFEKLDTNKDNFVTPDEINALCAERFPKVDLDGNGYVTEAEAEKYEKLHGL